MTASIAKARLLAEGIEQKKLAELKEVAAELELSPTEVKHYGSLSAKATWLEAVNQKIAEIFGGSEESTNHQGIPTPEEKLEAIPNTILTEESMIAPEDSQNFVESPVPPASVPIEFPEEEDEESYGRYIEKLAQDYVESFVDANTEKIEPIGLIGEEALYYEEFRKIVAGLDYYQLSALYYGFRVANQDRSLLFDALKKLGNWRIFTPDQIKALYFEHFYPSSEFADAATALILFQKQIIPKPDNCCRICGGAGLTFWFNESQDIVEWDECGCCGGKGFTEYPPCPNCVGTGEVLLGNQEDYQDCKNCGGTGYIQPTENKLPWDDLVEKDPWPTCPDCQDYLPNICPTCNDLGQINPEYKADLLSGGKSNYLWNLEAYQESGKSSPHTPCETCNGTGLVPDFNGDGDEICETCNGTGYKQNSEPPFEIIELPFPTEPMTQERFNRQCDESTKFAEEYLKLHPWKDGEFEAMYPHICKPIDKLIPDKLEASDFEKKTIVEFFKAEGMPKEDIEELQSKPLSKLEASACLGFVEHYKKSAEIALRLWLVDWVNDLAGDVERCLNRADQINILFSWKFISEVKTKLAHHFQLKPGEINCFITPDGYRVSVPNWTKEQILTPKETEFITTNDPVVAMLGNGYLHTLEHFKKQVTLHLIEVAL